MFFPNGIKCAEKAQKCQLLKKKNANSSELAHTNRIREI